MPKNDKPDPSSSVLRPGETVEQIAERIDAIRARLKAIKGVRYTKVFWPPDHHGIARPPLERHLSHIEPLAEADVEFFKHASEDAYFLIDQLTHERTIRQQIAQELDTLQRHVKCCGSCFSLIEATRRAETAEADLARLTEERNAGMRYLARLFLNCAPQCEPEPDVVGLATQIDNYIAGLQANLAHVTQKRDEAIRNAEYLDVQRMRWQDKAEQTAVEVARLAEALRSLQTEHKYECVWWRGREGEEICDCGRGLDAAIINKALLPQPSDEGTK